jgi:hypothetical protein
MPWPLYILLGIGALAALFLWACARGSGKADDQSAELQRLIEEGGFVRPMSARRGGSTRPGGGKTALGKHKQQNRLPNNSGSGAGR